MKFSIGIPLPGPIRASQPIGLPKVKRGSTRRPAPVQRDDTPTPSVGTMWLGHFTAFMVWVVGIVVCSLISPILGYIWIAGAPFVVCPAVYYGITGGKR